MKKIFKKAHAAEQNSALSLTDRLQPDVLRESCVVFVGAGSTTERYYRNGGFYAGIRKESAYPTEDVDASFPQVMQYYCDQVDGGRHNRLIQKAISYVEMFCSPGERNRSARAVASTLATIPYFNRIVTTNWDPILEREMDVLVPMVEDRDLAFWDDKKRQILKIHGCITRPYSIVATQSDYDSCASKSPLIFNKLRDLMATKTFIFIGYSMRDEDFREIWRTITDVLGHFTKLAYAVDPNATSEATEYWRERGIKIISAPDMQFLSTLKTRLESEGYIPSRKFLQFISEQQDKIIFHHLKLDQQSNGGVASAMYQDGLLHELEDVISAAVLGSKRKEDFEQTHSEALAEIKKMRSTKDSIEVAYWTGRAVALDTFCSRKTSPILPYFHPQKMIPIPRLVKG